MATLLEPEEELALLRAWRKESDRTARARLVAAFEPLCRRWAWHYARRGGDVDDLSQEARMGLMAAIDKFDLDSGLRLATYARFWIQHHVERALQIGQSGVYVPLSARRKLRAAVASQCPEAAPAGLETLAQAGVEYFTAIPVATQEVWEDAHPLARGLTDDPDPENTLAERLTRRAYLRRLHNAMNSLDTRRRLVVECRFLTNPPHTLEDIAQVLHLTRERVRQLEQSAITRLKATLNSAE